MCISDVLAYYRNANLLSQRQMAEMLGISQVAYHKWESGRNRVQLVHYCRIATVCRVNLLDILPEEWQEKIREDLGYNPSGCSAPEGL
ncbi:helix-turn-helix domain-containing protein [Dyadobacter sp. MSC1_007]|jgi:transcriptional regulator with XRE-family HTH domain|uniref:helix-turn-helix domain-containing protein n=1 Tax=Dyadobacter sp. MSC1_007 TaxID=2909264 RepID=UPI00202E8A0D|nr:helix-turn-helix transcriptional regulator [Dyadobacter sp. MSC1_007]